MKFDYMFSPIQVGPMVVPNRFVVPPMSNNYALTDGNLSDRSRAYYEERAIGGFGLITIEATVVDEKAKGGPKKSCLFADSHIEGLKRTVDACHKHGAKLSIQLQHAGPEGNAKAAGHPIVSASPISAGPAKDIPLEMTTAAIYRLIDRYADAAERAKKAGIDAVEIHCAHGYLVSSFMSPQTNKRVDEFGGSFENRMRLPRLIIEKIRERIGEGVAIICRINSSDETPGGLDLHDNALIAAYLESCGVDALNVSRSVHSHDEYMWAPTVVHAGFNIEHVSEIKKAVSIPVITVGRFTDPFLPELLVKEGRCDLVAFGRQSIADPWMPRKAQENRMEDVTPCIACLQGCVHNMFKGMPVTCLVNPFVGKEDACRISQTNAPKKIMVIGGGVGGMEAAWILAGQGHDVTLYEATDKLGGQMRLAAFPPGKGDITNMVRSYIVKCEKNGVRIEMNAEVSLDLIEEKMPDVCILATGAQPIALQLPGMEEANVVQANDVLDGKVAPGKKVLVVGGGMVGSETADFLGERNYDVTVVELRNEVAADVVSEHRLFLMRAFEANHVKTITEARVNAFLPDGVAYTLPDGKEHVVSGFDTLVLALGARAYNPLEESVKAIVPQTFVIGDAVQSRRALDATKEAMEVAMEIAKGAAKEEAISR